jgi:hypothetical protein
MAEVEQEDGLHCPTCKSMSLTVPPRWQDHGGLYECSGCRRRFLRPSVWDRNQGKWVPDEHQLLVEHHAAEGFLYPVIFSRRAIDEVDRVIGYFQREQTPAEELDWIIMDLSRELQNPTRPVSAAFGWSLCSGEDDCRDFLRLVVERLRSSLK